MYDELRGLLAEEIVLLDEPMKNHTTFKIGGPADMLVCPRHIEEIKIIMKYCNQQQIPFMVLGMGSNLLVRDKGIRGVVVKLGQNFQALRMEGEQIWAQSGVGLSQLAHCAAEASLSGLEFAEGIPGSLGGAVAMNAGAYEKEMQDVIIEVEAIDRTGEIHRFSAQEAGFAYRKSIFQDNGFIIVSARMQLNKGFREDIEMRMQQFAKIRREKQPLEYPSAGSTFKRPPGMYVGPMIEELSLKGYRIGGAEVSTKHAGFIVNRGDASAADVINLIDKIQSEVRASFGVDLQPEIRIVGEA
ncbi:UDP-N-acetylenolpyruvoylglucosamine reductase [Syntrophomonas zehnderi OL-4]|uniref:UDP-N-acetylenolpyruvoylglucosamine reductase n=1 Tax=Syntrophomonas zehnderi OL-4 TaxID=690567 RepID=A0A0E4GDD4_9FIRM|nr:UDP-N-acetylmuramate dehydrogenase [Syntrophomonas zehnderi]CFX44601.1 UDP-N-acetylenolpyruvoylglucosamine reductase [Syntrophomonas zehnderi OL-4]